MTGRALRSLPVVIAILASVCSFFPLKGMEERLQASLITCYPGPRVYELVGHEAIRIYGMDSNNMPVDSVWNYGVFDFASPNFIPRFVKGETDYMLWGCPFHLFIREYQLRGSKVVEQNLNLTPQETYTLRKLLQINALPQNRVYRYNYVRDNCSTRVVDMLEGAVAPRTIVFPDSVKFSSFRNAMRYYHRNYPWYQFGIDLALGGGIDLPISSREEMFAPLMLEEKASYAHFQDGEPLVKSTGILIPGIEDPVLPPTPWWATPLSISILIMLLSLAVAAYEFRTSRIVKWWNSIFFAILGTGGLIIWFLVFFSTHDSTSPNLLSLWLNPFQFAIAICIWWRHTRPVAMAMSVVNLITILILTAAWPLQVQSANTAVFPLWAATFALSLAYALIYPKESRPIKRFSSSSSGKVLKSGSSARKKH